MTKSSPTKRQPDTGKTASKRAANPKRPNNRAIILDTTEKLMLEEGYAAISTRRVAKEAGLKPPLVHYYFPTTDDLFLATLSNRGYRAWKKTAPGTYALFTRSLGFYTHNQQIYEQQC